MKSGDLVQGLTDINGEWVLAGEIGLVLGPACDEWNARRNYLSVMFTSHGVLDCSRTLLEVINEVRRPGSDT